MLCFYVVARASLMGIKLRRDNRHKKGGQSMVNLSRMWIDGKYLPSSPNKIQTNGDGRNSISMLLAFFFHRCD